MSVEKITNHEGQALNRLISQFKNKTNIENVIKIYSPQIQELENTFFDLLEKRYLAVAEGAQLDGIGQILNQQRSGLSDDTYRVLLYNKIAEYNSEGSIEDIISIFKTISGAQIVELSEVGIAGIALVGFDASPIIEESLIVNGIENAKAAGIKIISIILTTGIPFGFAGAIDALGFGDGEFARLIYHQPAFTFEGSALEFSGGFGVGEIL